MNSEIGQMIKDSLHIIEINNVYMPFNFSQSPSKGGIMGYSQKHRKEDKFSNHLAEHIQFAVGKTSIGLILVAQSNQGICAVLFDKDKPSLRRELKKIFFDAHLIEGGIEVENSLMEVIKYIENPSLKREFSLDMRGTDFQKKVWKKLCEIPLGSTVSYTTIAKKIGSSKAFRAVARACATNALAFIVPCHRVVRKSGALSGYRWGLYRKEILLKREQKMMHEC